MITEKIVPVQLNGFPDYYERAEKVESKQVESLKPALARYAVDASIDSIVDAPFTETYQSNYIENRREHKRLLLDD
jgi:hypothetical protein